MTIAVHIRRIGSIIVFSAFFCTLLPGQEHPAAQVLADRAYALIGTNPVEAISLFQQALKLDPANVMLLRQIGYLHLAQGDEDQALEQLSLADRYAPSDTIKLQRAYILASLGRGAEASLLFRELESSPIPELRRQAEVAAAPSVLPAPRHWTHLYAAPYYDTRWKALFYQAHVQHGYDFTDDRRLSLYGKASVSGDNKSRGVGLAPLVISDNTLILAAGFRVKPFAGLMIDVQEGLAIELMDKGSGTASRGDFRAVALYGVGYYAPTTVPERLSFPMTPFADLYASAGYYSRYKNGIAYAQARAGLRVVEVYRTSVELYGRLDLVRDTEGLFFNNLVEAGGGVRLTPDIDWGIHLVGEYHRGWYSDVSAAAVQERSILYPKAYDSVRFFLIFEKML